MEQFFCFIPPSQDADEVYTDMQFWTDVRRYVLTEGPQQAFGVREVLHPLADA